MRPLAAAAAVISVLAAALALPSAESARTACPYQAHGGNTIPLDTMTAFVSLEVYAARAWAGPRPYPDGRIGFAWNQSPRGAQPAETQQLATRLAQSIQGAFGDGGTAAKACSPQGAYTWCAPQLPGAAFNTGWKTFESW